MADASGQIILLSQNLFFQGRIEAVAAPLGFRVRQAHNRDDFWELYAAGDTFLALVDLEGDDATWTAVLTELSALAAAEADSPGADASAALAPGEATRPTEARSTGDSSSLVEPAKPPESKVKLNRLRLVAFGPHEDTESMERAKALGCHQALSKGRFSSALPELIGAASPFSE